MFIDCTISPGRSLEVVSQSSDYNSEGEFKCLDNKILAYYSNKSKLVSNKTKCLATAQWENSDIVQCWAGACCSCLKNNFKLVFLG